MGRARSCGLPRSRRGLRAGGACPGSRSDRVATAPAGAALDRSGRERILALVREAGLVTLPVFVLCVCPGGFLLPGRVGCGSLAERGFGQPGLPRCGPVVVVRSHDDGWGACAPAGLPHGGSATVQSMQAARDVGSCPAGTGDGLTASLLELVASASLVGSWARFSLFLHDPLPWTGVYT